MFYSITIDGHNTWDEWRLIPTSRPVVNPPPVNFKMIEIPGMNGALDITGFLNPDNKPPYGLRTGSWEFVVANPNIDISGLQDLGETGGKHGDRKWISNIEIDPEDTRPWVEVYSDIMTKIHGIHGIIKLSDDPDYRYVGRVALNEWRSEEMYSTITIDYQIQPFKFPPDADVSLASISDEYGGVL